MSGVQHRYEQVSFGFDGGVFLLLKLTGLNHKKNIIIFYDQMTPEQYRMLKFIHYASIARDKK